jgi:TolA-binding protein
MSTKPGSEIDPLDLLLRARSTALGSDEARSLERALSTSAALRIAHEVGQDLEFACRVRARDQLLLDRALARALTPTAQPRARGFARLAGIVAATFVVASAAAATHAVVRRLAPSSRTDSTVASAPHRERQAVAVAPRGPEPSAPSSAVAPVVSQAAPPLPAPRPGPIAAPSSAAPTAAGLFRDAGAARRSGDVGRARALYAELQSRFPVSNEAAVSHVSLGNLLLSAGTPQAAERSFARYLSTGQRSLREEALAGVAEAFFAMGRIDDERRAWEDVLRIDSGGVYASRARRRLAEIDQARLRSSSKR